MIELNTVFFNLMGLEMFQTDNSSTHESTEDWIYLF